MRTEKNKLKGLSLKKKSAIMLGALTLLLLLVSLLLVLQKGRATDMGSVAVSTTQQVSDNVSKDNESKQQAIKQVIETTISSTPATEETVAMLESKLSELENGSLKDGLKTKIDTYKKTMATQSAQTNNQPQTESTTVASEEPKSEEVSQASVVVSDEQPARVEQPVRTEQVVTPAQTQQAQTQPKPQTQAPVQTTQRQTTQAPVTTTTKRQPKRLNRIGNTGKEFKTFEEADAWARSQNRGYFVFTVMWDDYETMTYSVDF